MFPQLRPQKILQSVKAICALLGRVETIEIRDCCDKFNIQCLEFDKAKGNEEPSGKLRQDILAELGEHYATFTVKNDSNKDHSAGIKATILRIRGAVQSLVEMYTKTFRVNFSFDTPALMGETGKNPIISRI